MKAWRRITVAGVLVLSACGGAGSGVSASAGKVLDAQVDAIRTTAAREDRSAAAQQLMLLRASVDQLESDGDLSESAAARIRGAADTVESRLALLRAPTTTTTTTTSLPFNDDRGNGKGREDDERNGKDHEKD